MKDFHVLALSNDNGVRTYAILAGEKPIGRAIRKDKNIVFQVTGYPPQKAYGSNVERIIAKWLDSHYVELQEAHRITRLHNRMRKMDQGTPEEQKRKSRHRAIYQRMATPMRDIEAILQDIVGDTVYFSNEPDDVRKVEQARLAIKRYLAPTSKTSIQRAVDIDQDDHVSDFDYFATKKTTNEGDVVKHKFGLKQQQKNKTKYRFYQEIKDDIPVFDRGRYAAVKPQYIASHRHPENLEPFDHFIVEPSNSGANGRIIGITRDGMRVLADVSRLAHAKAFADAWNRGGFSDKDPSREPLDTLESRCSSAALKGINLAENPTNKASYESSWQKRYRTDPEFRERQKQNERNRRKNPEYAEKKREYQRERSRKLYADPDWREEDLARRRDVYAANKDTVLAKRQALMKDPAYAARKAEYWKQDAVKRKELTQKFQQLVQDPDFDPGKLPTAELKKFIKFLEKGRV